MTNKAILFFEAPTKNIIATGTDRTLSPEEISRLSWLFGNAVQVASEINQGHFCRASSRDDHTMEYQCRGDGPEHGSDGYIKD